MGKIILLIPILLMFIPIVVFADTDTFIVSGGEKIEKEIWFPSGSVDYSIHVSGGDEKIIIELLDPEFNSLVDGWMTESYSNTIITDGFISAVGNLGPRHPSSEGIHTFTFHNPDGTDRTVKLRLVVNEWNSDDEKENELYCGKGTHEDDGRCIANEQGGCLIATATYGSELAPQVQQLRELRDNSLLQTESGTNFMSLFNEVYYSFSPVIADYERENPVFKEVVKLAITPMITSLSILNYVEMDSEESVLGYGISLIVLNGMMYVGIPVLAIMRIRK